MNKITATGPDFTVTVEYEDLPVGEAVNLVVATVRALRYEERRGPGLRVKPSPEEWIRVTAPALQGHEWWYVHKDNPNRFTMTS